ncbi:MAG: ArsR/SmtB family transcription factor [Magnetospiraceae bacterium]
METAHLLENAHRASDLLKAMANETRLLILCQLADSERSVGELLETLDLGQSALSQHLAILRQQDLVTTRRKARSIYYSLKGAEPRAVIETLQALYSPDAAQRMDLLDKLNQISKL